MTSQLKDQIVGELDTALASWSTSHRDTKEAVQVMKTYYTVQATSVSEDAINRAAEDRKRIKIHVREHVDISKKASAATRDLRTQVESSQNGVVKMEKYGRLAAVAFTVLGVVVGLAIGLKAPGLGQIIAVVVGVIVGGFCCGCFAFTVYFVMSRRAKKRERLWKEAESDNQQGLALMDIVQPKRTCIRAIDDLLGDLPERDNYESTIAELSIKIDEYLEVN